MDEGVRLAVSFAMTGLLLSAIGALVLWLAARSRDGRLPRNRMAGVRTNLTLSSETQWLSAQRAAAGRTRVAGWGPLIAGIALLGLEFAALPLHVAMSLFAVLSVGSVAWLIAWSLAGAASAQRAARDEAQR